MTQFQFFPAQIQLPLPNIAFGFGYKGLVFFFRNNGGLMENMDQETHCTKMGADKSAKNTPNAQNIFRPNLSDQAQKFGIKKNSLDVRSLWWGLRCKFFHH